MEKVCMVCLERGSHYEIIENLLKDLLDIMLIQLDMTVSIEPIICTECVKRLHELFNFKTLCIYTEDALLPFFVEANGKTDKLDLRSVYSKRKLAECLEMEKEAKICRLCLEISANSVLLETALLETSIHNVFKNHLPEISLQATKRPFLCETCLKMLYRFHSFVSICTVSMCTISAETMKIKITYDERSIKESELEDLFSGNHDPVMENEEYLSEANVSDVVKNQVQNNVESDGEKSVQRRPKPKRSEKRNTTDDGDIVKVEQSDRERTISRRMLKIHSPPVILKEPVSCNTCAESYNNHVDLALHSIEHSGNDEYSCHICWIYASSERELIKKHIMAHKAYYCDICKKTCKPVNELCTHKMESHDIVNISCGEIVINKDHLKHMDVHEPYSWEVSGEEKLVGHLRIHRKNKTYMCPHCQKMFLNERDFNCHLRAHPEKKSHNCAYCGKGFSKKNALIVHLRTHTGEKPYVCLHCGKRSSTKQKLILHLRTHTGEKPFICLFCERAFSQKMNLRRHMLTHTGEKPHICPHCPKGFSEKSSLNIHVRTHTGDKPYFCLHCGRGLSTKQQLIFHLRNHTGKKPYSCPHCEKGFSKKTDLIIHLRIHSGEKPYVCLHCGGELSTKQQLILHLRTHTGAKPYICPHCGKGFSQKGHLKVHVPIHMEEKTYICLHCEKGFSHKSTLIYHLHTHKGEKSHVCPNCGKGFIQKSDFNIHVRIHTGEKPHICLHCGKGFSLKQYLIGHLRTHTGEKPYVCTYCGNSFCRKTTLNIHLRTHTGDKPYICTHCGKGFSQKGHLNYHVRIHTKKKRHSFRDGEIGIKHG